VDALRFTSLCLPLPNTQIVTQSFATITGDTYSAGFGANLLFATSSQDTNTLIVASPSYSNPTAKLVNTGRIIIYSNLNNITLTPGDHLWNTTTDVGYTQISIVSDEHDSRFGEKVVIQDIDKDGFDEVIVSSPMFTTKYLSALKEHEVGLVSLFQGSYLHSLPASSVIYAASSSTWSSTGSLGAGRFGGELFVHPAFNTLFLGQPRATNNGVEMAGSVWKVDLAPTQQDDATATS